MYDFLKEIQPLDGNRWDRVQEIFWAASELNPTARGEYLDRECANQAELRAEVERLLKSLQPFAGPSTIPTQASGGAHGVGAGDHIGPYRILRELGRGGMGAVYLAARDDREYEQRVAIKVIKAEAGSFPEVMARFRRERQILADLIHPNIARLLSGGVIEGGTPYLVMEYIEGLTIDDYCRANSLSTRARLELFRGVCAAVQCAHKNLVVHRDIKPSNVLVTDEGVPKLVDFGIAKLLTSASAARGLTAPAERIMTIEYASPEQVRGEPITTSTDIYSLGTVLYELLARKLPFDTETMNALDVQKSICETAPRPPSAMVAAGERKALRGDLDDIVLMAMRKEPAERYASVDQMAEDIGRYLDGFPVMASKGSWRYRAAKFARRHWIGVAAAAALFVTIVGFGIGMAVLARRAAHERDRATQEAATSKAVSDFLVDLFRKTSPAETQGTVTAAELLKRGRDRIDKELQNQPELRAQILVNIGHAYNAMGQPEEAVKVLNESLDARGRAEALGPDQSWSGLSDAYYDLGKYDESIASAKRALAIRRRFLPPDDASISAALALIATAAAQQGSLQEAEQSMAEAIAIDRRAGRLNTSEGADRMSTYAMVLQKSGKIVESLPVLREAVKLQAAADGELSTGGTMNQLGIALNLAGRPAEGEQTLRRAKEIAAKVYGPENPNVGVIEANLAESLVDEGRYAEAESLARDGLRLFTRALGEEHLQRTYLDFALGEALDGQQKYAEAEKVFTATLAMSRKLAGEMNSHTISAEFELGQHEQNAGKSKEAAAMLEAALAAFDKTGRDKSREYFIAQRYAGLACEELGRRADARQMIESSANGLKTLFGEDTSEARRSARALEKLSAARSTN